MSISKMQDNVERWMIHEGLSYKYVKSQENIFQIVIKHAGMHGIPVDIFEPRRQPGILVVGAKVAMKNNHIARYLKFNAEEQAKFEKRVADFCYSIQAIHKVVAEDGKQKIAVYVVLDDKESINQQTLFEAIDSVSEKHEKTSRFLLKTF